MASGDPATAEGLPAIVSAAAGPGPMTMPPRLATIENLKDLWDAERGVIPTDQARRIDLDALVDTGATLLSLPTSVIQRLGRKRVGSKRVTSNTELVEAAMYEAVRLTIRGRTCTMDVMEDTDRFRR